MSEYGTPATQAFVEWANAGILSTSFSLLPNLYSNSEVRTIILIWFLFFFQQRQENGLPSKLSKRFNPTLILQEERNLSLKSQGNKDKERNRYDSDAWVLAKWLQLCPTHCDSTDHSLPGSSVHGILQERILEWVAMPSSRGSSRPRDRTCVSHVSCTGRQVLNH